ncbi:MAG: ABC transporter substrate-binding protein [Caldilineaceae bacterium]|nr:ABC transporter substrate-binding protein [Caldilineaceae bacterium]MCY3992642.1 ABC transporter substrate-binding protein [Caldilineaceae bacterium]MDE0080956.1 ABC transporter substrate-binding protein [Caldilineaceae bacterium]MDE0313109.1 ABC transporter substrate-binding protein [Caldilineaceae bacterium]
MTITRKSVGLTVFLILLLGLLAACAAPAATETGAMAEEEAEAEEEMAAEPTEPWYDEADVDSTTIHICTDSPPKYGGEIVVAGGAGAMRGSSWFQAAHEDYIFSQLVDRDTDAVTIHPDVATSWDISDDGLTYTFHLRDDVRFHDGEQLTAEDVKFSLEMFFHPDVGASHGRTSGIDQLVGAAEFESGEADNIVGIKVLDDFTVELNLVRPRSSVLSNIAAFNIWPSHLIKGTPFAELENTEYSVRNPIGSGPFTMGEYEPDQFYILEANEDYYAGRPYLDRIIFRLGLGGATAFAALENGEVHMAGRVTAVEYERYKDDPSIVLLGGRLGGGMTVWPNHNRPEFQDARVRQALLHALDREAMAEAYYGELADVLHLRLTNPEFVSPNITKYDYNPDRARELLAEAGWDSDKEISFVTYYQDDQNKRIHAAMQQFWAEVGVKVDLVYLDGPSWVARVYDNDDFDLSYGCCGWFNPDQLRLSLGCDRNWPAGRNVGHYCNEEFDQLSEGAMSEPDPAKRKEMLYKATEIITAEAGEIPVFWPTRFSAFSADVCNNVYRQLDEPFAERYPATWYLAGE